MRRRKRSSLARSSLWSNATSKDEVADEDVEVIVEENVEEIVGKLEEIAIQMTGRSVVRMIVLPDSETTERTIEAGAETTTGVVETDVITAATTETESAKTRSSKMPFGCLCRSQSL